MNPGSAEVTFEKLSVEELCTSHPRNVTNLESRRTPTSRTTAALLPKVGVGGPLSRGGQQSATVLCVAIVRGDGIPQRAGALGFDPRCLSDPSELSYYRAYGPAHPELAELMGVAGSRWRIEEGYEQAKGEGGLDQKVRSLRAWRRHVTLAFLAHAV